MQNRLVKILFAIGCSIVTTPAWAATVAISPTTASVKVNGTFQFSKTGGAAPYTYAMVSGGGSINATTGLYTAPATPGNAVVKVTGGGGNSSSASITITQASSSSSLENAILGGKCSNYTLNGFTGLQCLNLVYDVLQPGNSQANLKLDLFLPLNPMGKSLPLVMFVHGGGWSGGNRKSSLKPEAKALVAQGYAVASISYRLTKVNKSISGEVIPAAIFPAQIQDVRTAVRYLRKNAGSVIDGNRIAAFGSSAGGHLAALTGTSGNDATLDGRGNPAIPSNVQAVIDFYGPTDFSLFVLPNGYAQTYAPENLVGGPSGLSPSVLIQPTSNAQATLIWQANPLNWVDPTDPPMLVMHGDVDTSVPVQSSRVFFNALQGAGIYSEYYELPGAGHASSADQMFQSMYPTALSDFLNTHL